MKKTRIILLIALCILFVLFAIASGESTTVDQGTQSDKAITEADDTALGSYSVEIADYRFAKDFEGKDCIIVKYVFGNVSGEEPASFMFAFSDYAFQNGVGLNEAYILDDSANYSSDNQSKEIKKGATLEVEVAYELNDTTSPVEIEVEELFSFDEKTITKPFTIAE